MGDDDRSVIYLLIYLFIYHNGNNYENSQRQLKPKIGEVNEI